MLSADCVVWDSSFCTWQLNRSHMSDDNDDLELATQSLVSSKPPRASVWPSSVIENLVSGVGIPSPPLKEGGNETEIERMVSSSNMTSGTSSFRVGGMPCSVFPVVIRAYPYRCQFSLSHQTLQFERPALVTSGVRFVNAVDFMAKHASSVYVYCVCYIPDPDCRILSSRSDSSYLLRDRRYKSGLVVSVHISSNRERSMGLAKRGMT